MTLRALFAFPARPARAAALLAPGAGAGRRDAAAGAGAPPPLPRPTPSAPHRRRSSASAAKGALANKPYLFVEKQATYKGMPLPPLKFFEPPAEYYELKPDPVRDPLDVELPAEDGVRDLYRDIEEAVLLRGAPPGFPDADIRRAAFLGAVGQRVRSLEEIRNEVVAKMANREHFSAVWRRRYKTNAAWGFKLQLKRKNRTKRMRQIEKQTYPW